jgi:hypothetical protein
MYTISRETSESAAYSASIVDNETDACFFDFQLMGPPANVRTFPEQDLRSSMSPAQSESV